MRHTAPRTYIHYKLYTFRRPIHGLYGNKPVPERERISEEREGGVGALVLALELFGRHHKHHDALDKPKYTRETTEHPGADKGNDACGSLAEVEILYAETAKENSEQRTYAAALAVAVGSKHIVVFRGIGTLAAHVIVGTIIVVVLIHRYDYY